MRPHDKAFLLIACVRSALINGCLHYDKRGRLLETETEILEALADDQEVTVDASDCFDRTTIAEQLAALYESQ